MKNKLIKGEDCMRKRSVIMLLVVVMVMSVCLSACGEKQPETTAPVTTTTKAAENSQTTEKEVEYPYICTALRSLSNPFHQMVIKGMEIYAAAVGIPSDHVLTITHDNDTQKLLSDMEALITKYNGNIVFQVDPNQKSDLIAIAELCEENKVYWASIWSIPDEIEITDYDHWVAAINFGDYESGYLSAKTLFESMGGEGEVWFLNGTTGHASATSRREGVQQALDEYPNIVVVGEEDCTWEKTKGYNSASNAVTAFPNLEGIWSSNDNMGIGAIEALRAKNVVGKVVVAGVNAIPDMVKAIVDGEAVATISTDPLWQGGITLAMCVDSYLGKYDPSSVDAAHRYWLAKVKLITKENAQGYIDSYINGTPSFDYTDYFADKYVSGGR